MSGTTEIVLFHVDDPKPIMIAKDADLWHRVIFELCIRSIRRFSPNSTVTLLTDETTQLGGSYPDVTIIRTTVDIDKLMYERSRLYKEHVERRSGEPNASNIAFIDTDTFVMRDLGPVFTPSFDVALTIRLRPDMVLDGRGVYHQATSSPINGGVLFAKPTPGARSFFQEHMRVYDELHASGLMFTQTDVPQDIRRWGGDQFAYGAMVGNALMERRPTPFLYKNTWIHFYDCDTHNYSPAVNTQVTSDELTSKYVVHMKGPRKFFMPTVAKMLQIA